jgi:glycerol-3-phosphate O-acyltransferase
MQKAAGIGPSFFGGKVVGRGLIISALITVAIFGNARAEYISPAEPSSLVNRTKVTLDEAAMADLSKQLVQLCGLLPDETWAPKAQRRHAQIVGLALAIDPANQAAHSRS